MRPSISVLLLNCAFSVQAQTNGGGSAAISLDISPVQLTQTFPGGTKSILPGGPPLPTASIVVADYPPQDKVPPTDSTVVKQWIAKIDMSKIPSIKPNGVNGCLNTTFNSDAIAKAGPSGNCWWTCGGCTRPGDITTCPEKGAWGVTFDDGPSDYTPNVLQYLDQHQLKATFFIVASRAIDRPDILRAQYMLGHELCIHTYSHPVLTTLSNEQIIAEVAWSMKVFKDILGVVPLCFRAPYADLDDRVRFILTAMGLKVILWTRNGDSSFDTEDWRVVDGSTTTAASILSFQKILTTASSLQTGFIVLAHDLFPQTVALSLKSFLPTALSTPTIKVQSVNICLGHSVASSYFETASGATNATTSTDNSAGHASNSSSISNVVPNNTAPSATSNSPKNPVNSAASRAACSIGVSAFLMIVMLVLV